MTGEGRTSAYSAFNGLAANSLQLIQLFTDPPRGADPRRMRSEPDDDEFDDRSEQWRHPDHGWRTEPRVSQAIGDQRRSNRDDPHMDDHVDRERAAAETGKQDRTECRGRRNSRSTAHARWGRVRREIVLAPVDLLKRYGPHLQAGKGVPAILPRHDRAFRRNPYAEHSIRWRVRSNSNGAHSRRCLLITQRP
jgi:hypothetical protein